MRFSAIRSLAPGTASRGISISTVAYRATPTCAVPGSKAERPSVAVSYRRPSLSSIAAYSSCAVLPRGTIFTGTTTKTSGERKFPLNPADTQAEPFTSVAVISA